MKTSSLPELGKCTGCMACLSACNHNVLELIQEGLHYHIKKNDSCVDCGLCAKICPVLNIPVAEPFEQKFYCGWNKDQEERQSATSGGVGSALARYALEQSYYVVGAVFDDDWHLHHDISNDEYILDRLRGSKYLQSDTSKVYRKVRELLKEGKKVLFIGTPCQVEAVKAVTGVIRGKNLVTCGFICHGVNSPYVWNDFRHYIEGRCKSKLIFYNFRSKAKGWGKLYVDYTLFNGKRVIEPARKNLFHVWFGKHYMMRESCFNCPFRTEQRYADITIGDFWGIEKVEPTLDTKAGVSVLVTSTERGDAFVKSCDGLYYHEVDATRTPKVLKGYVNRKSLESIDKEVLQARAFKKLYEEEGFQKMSSLYPCPSFWDIAKDYFNKRILQKGKK